MSPSLQLTTRADVFTALWSDPKYLRLTARKDAALRASVSADNVRHTRAAIPETDRVKLAARAKAACRRVQAYEDAALTQAGFRP